MKYTKYILTLAFILASFIGFSQVKEPGDPGGSPSGEPPLGGGAPVGSGMLILLGLGATYGAFKVVPSKEEETVDMD